MSSSSRTPPDGAPSPASPPSPRVPLPATAPPKAPPSPPRPPTVPTTPITIVRATRGAARSRAAFERHEAAAAPQAMLAFELCAAGAPPLPQQTRPPVPSRRRFSVEAAPAPARPPRAAAERVVVPAVVPGDSGVHATPVLPQRQFVARESAASAAIKRKLFSVADSVRRAREGDDGAAPVPRGVRGITIAGAGEAATSPRKRARLDPASFVVVGGTGRTQPEAGGGAGVAGAGRRSGPLHAAVAAVRAAAKARLSVLAREPCAGDEAAVAVEVERVMAGALAVRVIGRAGGGGLVLGIVAVAPVECGGGLAAGDGVAVRAEAEEEVLLEGDFAIVPAPWTVLHEDGGRCRFGLPEDGHSVVLAPVVAPFPAHLQDAALRFAFDVSPSLRKRALRQRFATAGGGVAAPRFSMEQEFAAGRSAVLRHAAFAGIAPHEKFVELSAAVVASSADDGVAIVRDANNQFGLLKGPPPLELPVGDAHVTDLGRFEVAFDGVPPATIHALLGQLGFASPYVAASVSSEGSRLTAGCCARMACPVFLQVPSKR